MSHVPLAHTEAAVPVLPDWMQKKNNSMVFRVEFIESGQEMMLEIIGYEGLGRIRGYDLSGKSIWERQLFFLNSKAYALDLPRRVAVFKIEVEGRFNPFYIMNK